ncbi:hypothetical protein [Kribbella sindirgiensis]|uniref:Uncharacterized protein n=1 Tax=Kribbella sindirgiensis TaxID=1124744 RepID=A0A4R0IMT4_9ACTN|nr:hypothetical protein [Kribbella sindirgiensis]TCC34931.1 hypothetical protein E0H50_13655 [Kribbella sindirgiensis]
MSRHSRRTPDTDLVGGSGRLLIAPITITATKPLLPSHAKGLFWVDVAYRATRRVADVDYHWSSRLPHLAGQTVRFWEYLDRTSGAVDYARWSEDELGQAYVRFHTEPEPRTYEEIRPYVERAETDGWVHPASRRLLQCWKEQLELLGVVDPGLERNQPLALSIDGLIEQLGQAGLVLDHRRFGGPAYLDGTRWGLPLRPGISADGHANYVVMLLRDLLPIVGDYSAVLMIHDQEVTADYVLLARILEAFGGTIVRMPLARVPIEGTVQSSRYGGWAGVTLRELIAACRQDFSDDACRLGMRMYFIAMLQRAASDSFRLDLLRRAVARAERILESADDRADAKDLVRHQTEYGWVDPYQLTADLLSRRRPPGQALLRAVYL